MEPDARVTFRRSAGVTAHLTQQAQLPNDTGGPFSLRRGLNYSQSLFKLSITFTFQYLLIACRNKEGDPSGRPRFACYVRQQC